MGKMQNLLQVTSIFMSDVIDNVNNREDVIERVCSIIENIDPNAVGGIWDDIQKCECGQILKEDYSCPLCLEIYEKDIILQRVNKESGRLYKLAKPKVKPTNNIGGWD